MISRNLTLCVMLLAKAAAGAEGAIDSDLAPGPKGRAIAYEASRRDAGFRDSIAEVTMKLIDAQGRERTRRLTWKTLEAVDAQDGDRSLTVFHEPPDIAGTALLSHTHIDRADDQWLYLPALKRVKRIASGNRSGPFVGSEFAYEDLLSDEVEKFAYRWLKDEPCGVHTCFVVERRPNYEGSGYLRQIVWLDQKEFRPLRIEYFDPSNRLEKTLTFDDYSLYRDRYWRARSLRMRNVENGNQTILNFEEIRFQTDLTELDFDPSALRRLR